MPLPQIDSLKAPDAAVAAATPKPRRFKYLNVPLMVVVALLAGYGLLNLYSVIHGSAEYSFTRQLAGVAAGAVAMMVIWRFDYRLLSELTVALLVVNVVLILSPHLPFIGQNVNGAQSWINIGMSVQPGEFAKLTVILLDASVVARYGDRLWEPRVYLKAVGIMLVPFVCIMTQPDLGTGLVYLLIAAVALVMGGAKVKHLLATLAVCVALVALVFAVDQVIYGMTGEYKLLKQYQRNRLLVFLNHDSVNLSEEGYNLQQAQIAIGSGGLFGKGLFNATQATLGFVPEAETDFIFCSLAEQLGFVGVAALLALYVALVVVCFRIARGAGDVFGMVVVMCTVGMWLFQILENIGMTLGIMPITGIPLPFFSYGSSFMVVNFMLLGLVGSVWAHSGRQG